MRHTIRRWRSTIALSVCLLGITASQISAQTSAVPSDKLAWDMKQDPSSLTFAVLVDGARQPLSAATCSAMSAGISTCQSPLPAMTPGTHRLEVVAIQVVGTQILDSAPSAPLAVTFIAVVTPDNVRLVKG